MQDPKHNLGIEALFAYAKTHPYENKSSWTAAKEFKPAPWEKNPRPEFIVDKLVHSDGFAPSSLDFQSNAFTRLA